MSVFETIENTITGDITDLLQQVGNLIGSVAPIFSGLFAIYLMLWAFNYWANGGLVEMGVDFLKKLVAWSLVIAFAFNAGEYVGFAKLLYNLSTDLSAALTGNSYSTSAMDTNWGTVDNILTQIESKETELKWFELKKGLALLFGIIFYRFCLLIYIVVMFIYLLVAKLSLLTVLMVGPLFLGCFLFPATRQWATNWLNQVFNYTITIVLLVALGMIQDSVFSSLILPILKIIDGGAVDVAAAILLLVGNIATVFCVTLISVLMAAKIPAIASSLTGGAAQVSGVLMRMDTLGAAAKGGLNLLKKAIPTRNSIKPN